MYSTVNRLLGSRTSRLLAAVVVMLAFVLACRDAPPQTPGSVAAPTTAPAAAKPPAALGAPPVAAPAASPVAVSASPSPIAATESAPVLSVGLANNILYAPWFVGVDRGIFLKHGVDVKLRILNTGPDVVKSLQAGEIDTGIASFPTLMIALNQDIKLKGFLLILNDALTRSPDDLFAIFAQPTSSVRSIADLRGKRVGTALGNTPDAYLKATLERAGVPIDAIEYVNVNAPNALAAYDSGLEVVVTTEPYGELLAARHPDARLLMRGGGLVAQRIALASTEEWLAAHPAIVVRLVAGFVESAYITRTQRAVAAEVVPRWLSGIDSVVAERALGHLSFDPRVSKLVQDSWDADNQLLVDQKKVKQMIPFGQAIDLGIDQGIPETYPQFLSDLKPLP